MLAAKPRADRVLFVGVVNRHLGLEEILQRQGMCLDDLPKCKRFDEVGDVHVAGSPILSGLRFQ